MLTLKTPETWQDLQRMVAEILSESGLNVEIEKPLPLARGQVEIDVYAVETVKGRSHVILCECKNWKAAVPQAVIHGFRTVIADSGANTGYLIASAGFQSGAFSAAELTNLRLVTWPEFQDEFEASWIENYMVPTVTDRLDPLMSFTEPLAPAWFSSLPDADMGEFMRLYERHVALGLLAMRFSRYTQMTRRGFPELPIRELAVAPGAPLPEAVSAAIGYKDLLDAMLDDGERAIAEFRAVRDRNGLSDGE